MRASCKHHLQVLRLYFQYETSEFYRCQVNVGVTRDNKEVLKVDTDGSCKLKGRIFPSDSNYAFDATETGTAEYKLLLRLGGTIWVADSTNLSQRMHHSRRRRWARCHEMRRHDLRK